MIQKHTLVLYKTQPAVVTELDGDKFTVQFCAAPATQTKPAVYATQKVREKDVVLDPLTRDEALLQMDLLGHDFFVYLDRDTSTAPTAYRYVRYSREIYIQASPQREKSITRAMTSTAEE